MLKLELGIENPTVLEAVRVHTMGSLHMSRLDKIIFLADMIEPGRDYPGQDRLDCLARRDLDRPCYMVWMPPFVIVWIRPGFFIPDHYGQKSFFGDSQATNKR